MSELVKNAPAPAAQQPDSGSVSVAESPRRTGAFMDAKHRRRYFLTLTGLGIAAIAITVGFLAYDNPMDFGTPGFWRIAEMRTTSLIVIIIVIACQSFATVSFQTATSNRIITPSIMGFESLYMAVNTAVVFFFGAGGVTMMIGVGPYLGQILLMVGFAAALYGWLLSGRFSNIHIMLLVGVVIGGGLGSLSTFMQRMLDPNEFDVLTARMFGNISNASDEYLPYAIPMVVVCCTILWLRARKMNVIALGRDTANNLGLNHRREVMITLLLVSILMSVTTSLVGPMTFLGFLIATLAYSLTDSYDHRLILPMAFLLGYVILAGAYFILRNFFYAQGAVTIIIELIGGLVFLIVVMRKGRL